MFREVRRTKQQLDHLSCIEILKKEKRGVLSVIDADGWPYGMPLNHWYNEEDGKLYFHCGHGGHREEALMQNPKVSYCVTGEGKNNGEWYLTFESVIVFGTAEFVEDRKKIYEISRRLSRKFTGDEAYIEQEVQDHGPATAMFAITPVHMTGKRVKEK
jgi:hypothetical protein